MKIIIRGERIEVTDAIRNYAEEKISSRYEYVLLERKI